MNRQNGRKKNQTRFIAFTCALTTLCSAGLYSPSAFAKESESKSSGGPTNLFISASAHYNNPMPGFVGSSLDINFEHLLRISAGVGIFLDSDHQTGAQMYMNAWAASLFWALSLGHLKWRSIYNTFSGSQDPNVSALLCPAGEVKFFIPTWSLSPSVGVGATSWISDPANTRGLSGTEGTNTYYSLGLDYLGSFGYIGGGINYSPKLPAALKTKPYFSAGIKLKFH